MEYLQIFHYDSSDSPSIVENDGEEVMIYDAGDSYVEHNVSNNEWKYWRIMNDSVKIIKDTEELQEYYYARIVQFVDYDIVPDNIIQTYSTTFTKTHRGKWRIIRIQSWSSQDPIPPFESWTNNMSEIEEASPSVVPSKKCTDVSQKAMNVSQKVMKKSHHQRQKQSPPQLSVQPLLQSPQLSVQPSQLLSQQPSPQLSLQNPLLNYQQLLSLLAGAAPSFLPQQQLHPNQLLSLQSQFHDQYLPQPPPQSPLIPSSPYSSQKKHPQQQPLVPLMQPGSHQSIPLVPSHLLPAKDNSTVIPHTNKSSAKKNYKSQKPILCS